MLAGSPVHFSEDAVHYNGTIACLQEAQASSRKTVVPLNLCAVQESILMEAPSPAHEHGACWKRLTNEHVGGRGVSDRRNIGNVE